MEVQALTGATGTEFEALSNQAKELGKTTMFSATQSANAMSELASAGFTTTEIMSAMPGLLDLAASGNIGLAEAANIASSTLRGFGLEASQSSHVSDVLAEAAARTNAGVTDMGMAMGYIAPVASAMGVSIEETAAAVGLLSNAGIQGSKAGTVLRSALSSLAKPSKEASELMANLGFNAYDTNGKMIPLNKIIANLQKSMSGLTDEQKQNALVTIFGQEALSGMLALIAAGPDELNNLTNGFENCDGAAKEMADTMQNNLQGKVTQFKSALEGAGIAIGENLIPALTAGVNKITDIVSAFNKLDPATQKAIVSVGATVAAIGPLMMIGGKLVAGIGKIISLVSTVTSLTGGVLVASLGAVALSLAAVGAGFYAWHEATDAANQSIAVSREEMSFMERMMADLTGMTTYSKDELIEMGLVYKDFNENISQEFQDSVKEMTLDIQDFNMSLNEINFDGVITEEEANTLSERVNSALDGCIEAIDSKYSEVQNGIREAFSMDGVIDESEQFLIEYWNNRGSKEKEEAQKLQNEINNIINNARAEGRNLTPEEEASIRNYYEQIKQLELECQASNQYEIEYATQEFQNRVSTMDAENATKLLQQRYEQYQEQQLATQTNYDTLINLAKQNYDTLTEEEKRQVDDTIARLEAAKTEELRVNQEKYDANVDYAIQNNEELANIFNRYTGEQIARRDLVNYQEYEQMRNHYEDIAEVTESGYKRVYDTATGTWKDVYVSIDATTGQLKGVYDLNTQNVAAMTRDDESTLRDEVAAWNETAAGVLTNCLIMGDAYIDAQGNITKSSGEIIGKLGEVVDANGEVVDAILDVNGNPINIGDNTDEVIGKLKKTREEVDATDGKKANINVTDNGTAAAVQRNIDGIQSYKQVIVGVQYTSSGKPYYNGSTMYATGTDNAMTGLATVAEYGPELIVSRSGIATLATDRQLINLEGGERIYNARQTSEILNGMKNYSSNDNSDLLKTLILKLDTTNKILQEKEFNKITENMIHQVDVNGVTDIKDITDQITRYIDKRTI